MDREALAERDICSKFITPAILQAGWGSHKQIRGEVSFTRGARRGTRPVAWPGIKNPARAGLFCCRRPGYFTWTTWLSAIFCFHSAGPVICTDSPLLSTATVTGMSLTSNS